ncbi:MAG: NUDIX domain-containing protein, partial [Hyphomicrobium sp.]
MPRPSGKRLMTHSPASRLSPPASSVAVLVVIFTVADGELQALLIHRSAEPYRGRWAIPGGLLASGEALHDA